MSKFTILYKMMRRRDRLLRFLALKYLGGLILPEYRFKWPQMAWWNDSQFNEYLEQFSELKGMNTDRHWMLYQMLRLVSDVPGDTAECGVFEGASSYLMCKRNDQNTQIQRVHHLFDSFEGLSTPSSVDGVHWQKGDLSCTMETVTRNLTEFDKVEMHRGWIPEKFSNVEDRKFCFVHIDVDLYQPTFDSIDFFYPRISDGGIILCDDYGFTSCPGATRAIDQYLENKREKMISLSCGGGFLIKGCATASH